MQEGIHAALDLERRMCKFMETHIVPYRQRSGYSNAVPDKLLCAIGNWGPVGIRLRWPYRSIDIGEAERLRDVARTELSECFA